MIFLAIVGTLPLTLDEALAYQKLTPLHNDLREMDRQASMLCTTPGSVLGPHVAKIKTYANSLAIGSMKNGKDDKFAIGSLLVKEKYQAKVPVLITVMKKVYKGNGASAWQYMMVDLTKKKLVEQFDPKTDTKNPMSKCLSCHGQYKRTDGVSLTGWQLVTTYNLKQGGK